LCAFAESHALGGLFGDGLVSTRQDDAPNSSQIGNAALLQSFHHSWVALDGFVFAEQFAGQDGGLDAWQLFKAGDLFATMSTRTANVFSPRSSTTSASCAKVRRIWREDAGEHSRRE
jgi:hypothetical protein